MRLVLLLIAALVALPVPVASAGGGGHSGACRGLSYGTRVALLDNCFDGTAQVVEAGTMITVFNSGTVAHTYTAVDRSFDSGTLQPGDSARIDVTGGGTFPVYCTLHSSPEGEGMAGLLVVEDEPQAGERRTAATALPPLAGFGAGLAVTAAAVHLGRRRGSAAPPA